MTATVACLDRRVSRGRHAVSVLVLLLAACQTTGPMSRSSGVSGSPDSLAASFYTPSRGPMPLGTADNRRGPTEPVKAIVYVAQCASPQAPPDHIEYFQSLGHAVAVPSFQGERCVTPTYRLGTAHAEIDGVVDVLRQLPWIQDDAIYLVGHGVGADVASTYTKAGTFRGIIGIAAACPFGIQNTTTMLTLRSLEDPVLANRGTRCSQFVTDNAMHVEFSGTDHTLWLTKLSTEPGTRQLLRNSIASFIDASDEPGTNLAETTPAVDPLAEPGAEQEGLAAASGEAPTQAEAVPTIGLTDAEEPAGVAEPGEVEAPADAGEPTNVSQPADDAPPEDGVAATKAGEDAADAAAVPATEADAAVPAETAADAPAPAPDPFVDADVLYLPTLQLPPGRN